MHHQIKLTRTEYWYNGEVKESSEILFHNDRHVSIDELRDHFNEWAEQDSIIKEFGTQFWFPDYSTKINTPGKIDNDIIASVNIAVEIIKKE
jgi:hypothetical protein